jgi:hypothetical protein
MFNLLQPTTLVNQIMQAVQSINLISIKDYYYITSQPRNSVIPSISPQLRMLRRPRVHQMLPQSLLHDLLNLVSSATGATTTCQCYNEAADTRNSTDERNHAS